MKYLVIICCIVLSSCYSRKAAQTKFGRAVATFPEIGAEFCAITYAPKVSIDSVFTSDSSKYKETIESLQGDLFSASTLTDSLIHALANGDTTCRKYAQVIMDLQRQLIALKQKVITLPPVTTHTETVNTVVNTAEIAQCRIQLGNAILLATDKTKEADKWRKIAKKRFWIILGLGAAMALGIFAMVRKKIVKKIPV